MRKHLDKKISLVVLFTLFATLVLASTAVAQQNLTFFTCTPVEVASFKTYSSPPTQTFTGKVWVRCNPPLSANQQFFAVPLTDAAEAARFLSLFNAAFVTGKNLEIGFLPGDTTGLAYNCTTGTTSCQPAISATIR
ncbi:MAG: hypothetical protein HY892_18320 [Deltaproteobacteria bacterium]|nr:hypothetical protein [Deltaproteobacteria bacterium]